MPLSDGRLAALMFAAAFLTRLVVCLGTAIFGTDGARYLLMADWFAAGRFQEALSLGSHPLYPLMIAATGPFVGGTEAGGNSVSVVLGSAAVVPLFLTVRGIFGRPPAFFVALLYAFHPDLVEVQADVMTEGSYLFFLFSSLWLTWRMWEDPSPVRGAVLGVTAAATFLVRPEGVLAVVMALAWPAARRERLLPRIGGVLLTLAVLVMALAPYLLWVKADRGRWGLSPRSSAIAAEKAVTGNVEQDPATQARNYGIYFHSMFRMTAAGLLIPFHLLGLASLRRIGLRKALFYFSFPLGLLGGPFFVIRTHEFMSGRYLLAGMTLLNALAALGLTSAIAFAARRWPASRWREAAVAAFVLAVAVLPGAAALRLRRHELQGARTAAQWIRSKGPPPRATAGPLTQVGYLAGSRPLNDSLTPATVRAQILDQGVEYYAYTERDVARRPETVAMLRSSDLLQPPVEIQGPPGSIRVYLQRVR